MSGYRRACEVTQCNGRTASTFATRLHVVAHVVLLEANQEIEGLFVRYKEGSDLYYYFRDR